MCCAEAELCSTRKRTPGAGRLPQGIGAFDERREVEELLDAAGALRLADAATAARDAEAKYRRDETI